MNDQQYFPGIRKPSTDFGAVRNQLQSRPFYIDVDLSAARSLSAGTQLVLPISGNFFYIDQKPNSGVAFVHFEDIAPGSTPVGIYPGAAFAVPFTQISIENVAQSGLSIRIIYGTDVNFIPSNAAGVSVLNSISVVDGGAARTAANQSFLFGDFCAALAANYSYVQIKNPATSLVNVYVKQVFASNTVGGASGIYFYDTDLTTAVGAGVSKKNGGAASSALIKKQQGNLGGTPFLQYQMAANIALPVSFQEPIMLAPGKGLMVAGPGTLVGTFAYFDWWEGA